MGLKPGFPDHWWTHYPLGQWAGYENTQFIVLDDITLEVNTWIKDYVDCDNAWNKIIINY